MPKRSSTRIWPWIVLVLLAIAGLGIWKNQTQWLEHTWIRSVMLKIGMPVKPNPSDWLVVQDHVQNQWVDRQDHSRVLVINGYIQNQLLAEQHTPDLKLSFFDIPESGAISSRIMPITEPPSLPQIRHAPYMPPAHDNIPVSAGGKRAFTLVVENVPEGTRGVSIAIAGTTTRN